MQLVVNEWLPEYFLPTATREEKESLENFLNCFMQRNDQILVRRPSPFLEKIYRYAKRLQGNYEAVTPIRDFIKLILKDPNRCNFIDEETIILSDEINSKLVVGNFSSDTYLFEAASQSADKIIITTDVRLRNHFNDTSEYQVLGLSDFMNTY